MEFAGRTRSPSSPRLQAHPAGRLVVSVLAGLLFALSAVGGARAQEDTELVEGRVAAEIDSVSDRRIRERLEASFESLEDLSTVEVAVRSGIVRLQGIVDTVRARDLADELARQIQGVSVVVNDVEVDRSVGRRLTLASARLRDRAWSLLDALPLLTIAIAVFGASIVFSRIVILWDRPFVWLVKNVFLRDLARQGVRLLVVVFGVLIALEIMDATSLIGVVLGAAGVVGLAVGFALRDLVENYLASILLSLKRPFEPRDLVRIEGHLGSVARLTSRATILVTPDGNHVRIPNANVFKATIENFTKNPQRRFEFGIAVGVDEDLVAASELGIGILKDMIGVIDDPAPYSRIDELGDSSVTLTFFGWIDQRQTSFEKVRSVAIRLVKQAFDRNEIEMPEPIVRVRVEGTPERRTPEKGRTTPSDAHGTGDVSAETHVDDLIDVDRDASGEDLLEGKGVAE
ncbi:MAG: mechanosensitive ion channel family protein [Myxococcota bacterium]